MKKKLSLKDKYVFLGMILIVASIVISLGSSLASDLLLLQKKSYDNSVVTLDVAADTMNTVLDDITKMINSIEDLESYRQIGEISTDGYAVNYQISQLAGRLNRMVMTSSDIEIIVVNYPARAVYSSFFSNEGNYRWLEETRRNADKYQEQEQGYLLQIADIDGEERLAVTAPRGDTAISVLVSQAMEERLGFLKQNLSIRQNDVEVVLGDPPNRDDPQLTKPLKLQGWEISCSYERSFLEKYQVYLIVSGVFFGLYLIASYFFLKRFGGSIFDPIRSLCSQVVSLDTSELSSRIKPEKRTFSFSWSVLFSYMVLSFLPVLIIAGSSYAKTQSVIKSSIGNIVEKNVDIVSRQTEAVTKNFLEAANEIVLSNTAQRYLISDSQTLDAYEIDEIQKAKNVTVYNLALYGLDKNCRYSSMYLKEYAQSQLPADGNLLRKRISWQPADLFGNRTIRIFMPIINTLESSDSYGKRIGYMVLDYLEAPVSSALNDLAGKYAGYGEIVSGNTGQPLYSAGSQKPDTITITQELEHTGWKINIAIPHSQYYGQTVVFIWVTATIIVVLCLFILLSSYFLYRYLLVNVKAIRRVLRHVNRGELDVRFSSAQKDEVYELGQGINQMLERINQLIEEKYVIELRSQEIELNLLQSQINPHFLCNTLRTIEYMASVNDPRTMEIIQKLMYLFRRCTDIRARVIPLEEELKYIAYYVDIQKVRGGDKFTLSFSVPEELSECHVLQFILQPVVENAIYHGFKGQEANGKIQISVSRWKEDFLQITVRDNGEGMDEQALENLRRRLSGAAPSKSVGLVNVHDRLKLYYGSDCGVTVSSAPGKEPP